MATNSKLTKVLEYIIKNDEEKAHELLHRVFIEKARSFHESLMSMDDEQNEFGGSGDQGRDLKHEIGAMEDEIDFEETLGEEGDDDEMGPDMGDDDGMSGEELGMGDIDSDEMGGEMGDNIPGAPPLVADKMHDLEAALAELKAAFAGDDSSDEAGDVDGDMGDMEDMVGDDHMEPDGDEVDGVEPTDHDEDEEEVDETNSWDLDEDFDDLAESLDLEVVINDMEKGQKVAGEVGSGKSGMAIEKSAKSPLPSSQRDRLGAKPVVTKAKEHSGYNLEGAPTSGKLPIMPTDNRRKKADNGMSKVSKEGNGAALLNKSGEPSTKMRPLSKGGSFVK